MYSGKLVFTRLMDHLPWHRFRRCVTRYHGNRKVKSFACADQYRCMAFARLTYRSSLRDIEACLPVHPTKLHHMGIRGRVSRNTLAHANAVHGWQIYADFAQHLIHAARHLHADDHLPGLDLGNTMPWRCPAIPTAPFSPARSRAALRKSVSAMIDGDIRRMKQQAPPDHIADAGTASGWNRARRRTRSIVSSSVRMAACRVRGQSSWIRARSAFRAPGARNPVATRPLDAGDFSRSTR